jgi:hypothetical protein
LLPRERENLAKDGSIDVPTEEVKEKATEVTFGCFSAGR